MKTIWKFPFEVNGSFSLLMPLGAEVLSVQVQHGQPCLWALVDPEAEKGHLRFRVYGTGHPLDGLKGKYIGTFQQASFVWHLFQV